MAQFIKEFGNVPETIRVAAELVCKRFCITGVCDPMYICNVIAFESATGNGEGFFDENPSLSSRDWEKAANAIQNTYCSLITIEEIEELTLIMKNKQIDEKVALENIRKSYEKYEKEMNICKIDNSFRIPYLINVLKNIRALVAELNVQLQVTERSNA